MIDQSEKSSLGRFIYWTAAAAYFVALMFLAYLAIALLSTKCENFGCTGIGIGWVFWIVIFSIALGLGLFIVFSAKSQLKLQWIMRRLLITQGVSGLILVGLYLVSRNTA